MTFEFPVRDGIITNSITKFHNSQFYTFVKASMAIIDI